MALQLGLCVVWTWLVFDTCPAIVGNVTQASNLLHGGCLKRFSDGGTEAQVVIVPLQLL